MSGDAIDRMIAEWAQRDPQLDASPLQVVGRLLRCAENVRSALVEVLRPYGLSYADFDVLNTLRRRGDADGIHARDLAQAAVITSGAMTARLDRLERLGLIARAADPGDRRAVRIRLTDDGDRTAQDALAAVLKADRAILEPLGDRQRDSLATMLKQLLLTQESAWVEDA